MDLTNVMSLASQSYFSFAQNVSVESRDARHNPKFSISIHILYCLNLPVQESRQPLAKLGLGNGLEDIIGRLKQN